MKSEQYGFTTDTNEDPEEKAKKISSAYRIEKTRKLNDQDVLDLLKVPDLGDEFESENKSEALSEDMSDGSSSDYNTENYKSKRGRGKTAKKATFNSKELQKIMEIPAIASSTQIQNSLPKSAVTNKLNRTSGKKSTK